jgi:putative restriction endonuclease
MRKLWTREETLAAFNVYCRTPFGRLHARNPEIIEAARHLGRTPDAFAMKCCNIASLDPGLQRAGIKGLTGASRLDRSIWEEFQGEPDRLAFESAQAFSRLTATPLLPDEDVPPSLPAGLERSTLVRTRMNQRLFRAMVLSSYGYACAVCRLNVPALLVASHIVPWAVDAQLRMNPHNGLCLCRLHDGAFDTGLMVITDAKRIAFTAKLGEYGANEAVKQFLTAYNGRHLSLPERWQPSGDFLARHRALHPAEMIAQTSPAIYEE